MEGNQVTKLSNGIVIDSRMAVYPVLVGGLLDHLKMRGLCDNQNIGIDYTTTDFQEYTLYHKQAFLACQYAYTGGKTLSGVVHDTEKLVLYGLMGYREADKLHKDTARHHIANCIDERDLEECIIDYECARYTKPDKPLNAYATIQKYRPETYEKLKETLVKFNLDSPENRDIDFHDWNALSEDEVQYIYRQNVLFIDLVHEAIQKYGVEKALQMYNDSFGVHRALS